MTYLYEKTAAARTGLRLHLNENTSGCSPAVIRALREMTPEAIACYPDCSAATTAIARHFVIRTNSFRRHL